MPTEISRPSLLLVETGITAIAIAVGFCWPRSGSVFFGRVERIFGHLAARPHLSVVAAGLAALILRLAMLPLLPIPQPFIHDEFSFLLAADTFAHGRLTNPTHPMWQHMESFHITWKPSYMSMYFPAQGLILAAGKKIAGDPWFGVAGSAALMCAVICWMLQGWLRPGWALLGGALAVLRLGLFSYWVNGYYGGAPAAIGGSLVLGAYPRILRRARMSDGLLMALGAAILAISRPWEGVLVCLPVGAALAWRTMRKPRPPAALLLRRAGPATALLVLSAVLIGYYDYRVFGSPFTLAYQVNRATYASAPVFIWQSPRPEPVYRHAVMRQFYSKWEMGDFLYGRTPAGFASQTAQKLGITLFFIFGTTLFPPLIFLPWVLRDKHIRFLTMAGAVFGAGLCLNVWLFPHYLAPFTGGLYVVLLQAMRHMRVWRRRSQSYGLALVRIIPLVCLLTAGIRLAASPLGVSIPRWPTMWYGTEPLGLPRAQIAKQLQSYPEKQLAIVRYSQDHSVFDDWVYNGADINNSHVVWAREMDGAANAELLCYFRERRAWLVQPDLKPPAISPYPLEEEPGSQE